MKFVQLLRPLFFVALGLHGLVLFLPYGESDSAVIEDVELADTADVPPGVSPVLPGTLPVPDLNATTGTKTPPPSPGTTAPTVKTAAASTAAARRTVTPRRAASTRSNSSGRSTTASNSSTTNSSQNDPAESTDSSQANAQSSQSTAGNSTETNTDSADSGLAVFEPPIDDPGADVAAANGDDNSSNRNSANATDLSVSSLLAKVTQKVPESLLDFARALDKSLTYSADNTDDDSAQKAREGWQADIQRQANVGQIEAMPPAEIIDLTQIEYPIESSVKAEGRSLRRCLTEDPKTAEIGVLFDARGNIVNEPQLLRSTGYSALNEEIKATVAAYDDFPSDRASKAYTFEVEVFYDNELCITATELQK